MSTGMRKWMEKGCPEIQCLPAQVSIDREELKQLRDHLEAAEKERDALRAKVAEMERQEPVAWCATDETGTVVEALGMNQSRRFDTALYLAPGAQPAPSVPGDILYRLGAAHDACLDEDHRECRDIITQLMCEIGPDGAVPEPEAKP